jgi:O-antigen/teichoic acid export membrane protein
MKGATWTIIERVASQFVRFAGNLILSRLLFPKDFEIAASVSVDFQCIQMFTEVGVEGCPVQHKEGDQSRFLNRAGRLRSSAA